MDKYIEIFMNNTSKLDTLTNSCGEIIKLANMIVENNSKSATITLLKKISEIINNHNCLVCFFFYSDSNSVSIISGVIVINIFTYKYIILG